MESIAVYVRIRPKIERESEYEAVLNSPDNKSIEINTPTQQVSCEYDYIFNQNQDQQCVFNSIQDIVDHCLDGYNSTLFAYGQTGSGKTYTLFGPDEQISTDYIPPSAGIIPRSINHLFNSIPADDDSISVHCSMVQIYNENIYDLLRDYRLNMPLSIKEDSINGLYVNGLSEYYIRSCEDCLSLMNIGVQNRVVRETHMNQQSSRSHIIFQLLIEKQLKDEGKVIKSKLNLVDLAGSEKWRYFTVNTNNEIETIDMNQQHIQELTNINKSLSTLSRCIYALSSGESHVPYRESKLTRLLQDSLGGNTKTKIIVTLSPSEDSISESISSLKFADCAKRVMVSVHVNSTRVIDKALVMRLEKEIAQLKQTIAELQAGKGLTKLVEENNKLKAENADLKNQLYNGHPPPLPGEDDSNIISPINPPVSSSASSSPQHQSSKTKNSKNNNKSNDSSNTFITENDEYDSDEELRMLSSPISIPDENKQFLSQSQQIQPPAPPSISIESPDDIPQSQQQQKNNKINKPKQPTSSSAASSTKHSKPPSPGRTLVSKKQLPPFQPIEVTNKTKSAVSTPYNPEPVRFEPQLDPNIVNQYEQLITELESQNKYMNNLFDKIKQATDSFFNLQIEEEELNDILKDLFKSIKSPSKKNNRIPAVEPIQVSSTASFSSGQQSVQSSTYRKTLPSTNSPPYDSKLASEYQRLPKMKFLGAIRSPPPGAFQYVIKGKPNQTPTDDYKEKEKKIKSKMSKIQKDIEMKQKLIEWRQQKEEKEAEERRKEQERLMNIYMKKQEKDKKFEEEAKRMKERFLELKEQQDNELKMKGLLNKSG